MENEYYFFISMLKVNIRETYKEYYQQSLNCANHSLFVYLKRIFPLSQISNYVFTTDLQSVFTMTILSGKYLVEVKAMRYDTPKVTMSYFTNFVQ